ncbi:DUF429 domain-containing protein [Sorangium sp. So ce385]|uniref:DUF429 domain-containing protein n=1 Tax=Sorangium sp. So ce385 TaxID=3133308 RepID=UPI003F5BC279
MGPTALRFLDDLLSPGARVAVGLDFAASEENWGLCVLVLQEALDDARIALLLPTAGRKKDGTPSANNIQRPSLALLGLVLERLEQHRCAASVAVDIPFGWPVESTSFQAAWRATEGWTSSTALPKRDCFERRLTDRLILERVGLRPLSVSADAIGQAAFVWAHVRQQLGQRLGAVDVGLGARTLEGIQTFETYPAAFVAARAADLDDYKSKPAVRRKLLDRLLGAHNVSNRERWEATLAWAIDQKGSPDACDALLCALLAWAHLRWRAGHPDARLTRPEVWLGPERAHAEAERIAREGWILIPWSTDAAG